MKKFKLEIDQMVSSWDRTTYEIEAESLAEAKHNVLLINKLKRSLPEETDVNAIGDIENLSTHPTIPGAATREYYLEGELIEDNSSPITQKCQHCLGPNVARLKWVNVNTEEIYNNDSGTDLEWCMDCKSQTIIIENLTTK